MKKEILEEEFISKLKEVLINNSDSLKQLLKDKDDIKCGMAIQNNADKFREWYSTSLKEYADWKIKECLPEKIEHFALSPAETLFNKGWNKCIDQTLTNKDYKECPTFKKTGEHKSPECECQLTNKDKIK